MVPSVGIVMCCVGIKKAALYLHVQSMVNVMCRKTLGSRMSVCGKENSVGINGGPLRSMKAQQEFCHKLSEPIKYRKVLEMM